MPEAEKRLQLPVGFMGVVGIRAGTTSRIWNPLERMNPPALSGWFGF
jgi:hypothetical protein